MTLSQRLEHFSKVDAATGCWLWTASTNKSGYGRLGVDGKVFLAHRLAYAVAHGAIPDGMHVCHRCDTPACINPDHLFIGTNADNMLDKLSKNRQSKGSDFSSTKLTEAQVAAIRLDKRPQWVIAQDYGISQSQVSLIHRNEEWRHLDLTQAAYSNGRIDNGNRVKGTAHPLAKLDDEKVQRIRSSAKSIRALSEEYGVSEGLISRVIKRTAWVHVT
jgi:hypothetical protein